MAKKARKRSATIKKAAKKPAKKLRPVPLPKEKRRGLPTYYLYFFVLSIVVLTDQLTKLQIESNLLPNAKRYILDTWLAVSYVKNTGGVFGLFQDSAALLAWLSVAVLIALIIYYPKFVKSSHSTLSIALISGGLIGNLVDRSLFGYVVDFIDFSFWPAFNVADASLTLGVFALIFYLWKHEV